MRPHHLVVLLVALLPVTASAAPRTWTDKAGQTVKGDFVRIHNGDVIISKLNKQVAKVPYWNLSEADREFVKKELEAKGDANSIPPEPPKLTSPSGTGSTGGTGEYPGPGAGPGPRFPTRGPGGSGIGPGAAPPGPGYMPPGGPGYPGSTPPGPGYPGSTPSASPPGYPGSTPGSASPPGYPGSGSTPSSSPGFPGSSSSPGYPGPSASPGPRIPMFQYKFECRKCGHTWIGDSPISTSGCPNCSNGRSSRSTAADSGGSSPGYSSPSTSSPSYPSSSPSSSASDAEMAGRRAGAITAVVLMVACPLVLGAVFLALIIGVIFFVVKAVSAPPATVRRHY